MADTKATLQEINSKGLFIKLIDNGDGTYSLATASPSGSGGSQVHGTTSDGAAFSDNPVIVGYVDSSGNAQQIEEGVTELPVAITEVISVDDNGGSLTVDGPLTDTELRASDVDVDPNPHDAGAFIDGSGTITTGGTSQQALASNVNRRYLLVQNVSSEALWVNFGTAAVQDQPSIRLSPNGGSLEYENAVIPTESVEIIGPTTGQSFTVKEA